MMNCKTLHLLTCLLYLRFLESTSINSSPFPDDFMFGVSTGAYQVEGAWNADGKGESIWDHFTHNRPEAIADGSNGDVACDSYKNYMTDFGMVSDLGVNHYRFSISWTRIMPTGFANEINQAGISYYRNLIKVLKKNNIEPLVTIYHWDLPQRLQEIGGWTNEFIVDIYVDYARVCFEMFGDDVKLWLTINEPFFVCGGGYGMGLTAPGVNMSGIADYMCTHNLLKAHAKAWHLYDTKFRSKQKGKVSLSVDSFWYEPGSSDKKDQEAVETALQFRFGWILNPIFNGDYPKVMRERVAKRSELEGFSTSRLPYFTEKEIEYIKGTHDFLGFNFYSSYLANATQEPDIGEPSYTKDMGVSLYQPDSWEKSGSPEFKVTPWGFRKILNWIKNTYNNPGVFITENGVSTSEDLNDSLRIRYMQSHLSNVRDAMELDNVTVLGYTAWTLMDDFEWVSGYTTKFGLYYVNFSDPTRTRIPRSSVDYYKKIIASHRIEDTDDTSESQD